MTDHFYIENHPEAADGAVWTVRSPRGVSVFRTADPLEAVAERDRHNSALDLSEVTA